MALTLPSASTTIEYVLAADRGSLKPTVFVLRPLMWEEMLRVQRELKLSTKEKIALAALHGQAKAEGRELNQEETDRAGEIVGAFDDERLEGFVRMRAMAARMAIVEIRGLVDAQGAPLQVDVEDFVLRARVEWINEIGETILAMSNLQEEHRKNSRGPQGRSSSAARAKSARDATPTPTNASKTK